MTPFLNSQHPHLPKIPVVPAVRPAMTKLHAEMVKGRQARHNFKKTFMALNADLYIRHIAHPAKAGRGAVVVANSSTAGPAHKDSCFTFCTGSARRFLQ